MSKIFAGIAVFPAGLDEYNISISLISSPKGAVIDNKSTSLPVKLTLLSETVKSMISSTFTKPTTIESYFTSLPPAFPADRYYDVFSALEYAKLIDKDEYPALPLNHGEAYAMRLPQGKTTTLLALDFTSPAHLYATGLSSTEAEGKRVNTIITELSASFVDDDSCQVALKRILSTPEWSNTTPEHILLIGPACTSEEKDTVGNYRVVTDICPGVPLSITTSNDIAHAAASFAYANSLLRKRHILAKFFMPLPVSVATASGGIVPISASQHTIPREFFINLTNSVNNQKTATARLLLGNHAQAKDNLQRAVVVLDNLKPLPKGEACIRVLMKVLHFDGWREAAQITLEQRDGPKKTFLFPRFCANLPKDYDDRFAIRAKKDVAFWSEEVVGKLPE